MKHLFLICSLALPSFAMANQGASFEEVWNVIEKAPTALTDDEAAEIAAYEQGLPQYAMNFLSVFRQPKQLQKDAIRTIEEKADYYPRLAKLLHPNGLCVGGTWEITTETSYTGAFAKGVKMPFIGRASVAMESTVYEGRRGFGFAGKLFPSSDLTSAVQTENFFSVDVLLGRKNQRFFTTELTNNPELGLNLATAWMGPFGIGISSALTKADVNPLYRTVKNLASMNGASEVHDPKFLKIRPSTQNIRNDESDFRREILRSFDETGFLKFDVLVAEDKAGVWTKVGEITADRATVSYGCDRRLHFGHPKEPAAAKK